MKVFVRAVIEVFKITPVWYFMAYQDIVARYRRTTFGPWWITLSTGISLMAMAVVWSTLFQMSIKTLLPYMAPGMVVWTFISAILMEGPTCFVSARGTLKLIKIPSLTFILAFILRSLYAFLQNSVVVIIVFLIFRVGVGPIALLSLLGVILLILVSFPVAIILGIIGSRFRDFPQVIVACIPFLMLLTPIMWQISILKGNAVYIAYLNPITYFVVIIRDPLLNKVPEMIYYYGSVSLIFVLTILATYMYSRAEKRLIYWI